MKYLLSKCVGIENKTFELYEAILGEVYGVIALTEAWLEPLV